MDSSDYTFLGARVLGLNHGIMSNMIENIAKIKYSKAEEVAKQQFVYSKYSTSEMHSMAQSKQVFQKI